MAPTRRVVLDVLIPHELELETVAERSAATDGVVGANATLLERDRQVDNVEVVVEGEDVDLPALQSTLEELGGSVHSIDQVACGDRLVEPRG